MRTPIVCLFLMITSLPVMGQQLAALSAPEFARSGRGSAWLERLVRDQEVGGSNPLAPTIYSPAPSII